MSVQPQTIKLFNLATLTGGLSSTLLTSGVFINTQTVTVNGVVFTSVTALGVTAGNFLIGNSVADSIANLANLVNNPTVTNATQVAISNTDAVTIKNAGIFAIATSISLILTSNNGTALTVSETQTNAAFTTTHTSNSFGPVAFGKASIQFSATGIATGNGVLTVDVSNDGFTWTAYNRLVTNVTNTNVQFDTRVASVTLTTNTSSVVVIDDPFAFYRANIAVTTDGSYSAVAYVI